MDPKMGELGPEGREDLVGVGVASGRLLRIDEVPVHDDFEGPAPRGDDLEVRDLVLELFQQPLRQTDGSRRVASLSAVLDRDLHGRGV